MALPWFDGLYGLVDGEAGVVDDEPVLGELVVDVLEMDGDRMAGSYCIGSLRFGGQAMAVQGNDVVPARGGCGMELCLTVSLV